MTQPALAPIGRRRHFLGLVAVLAASLLGSLTGCKRAEPAPKPGEGKSLREDKLVVFAAASLREAFTKLEAEFEQSHPGVEVIFNFAGTQELRTQLEHGAPVDVFASADQKHMAELVKAKLVNEPFVFAKNEPVAVVARAQQAKLRNFSDLPLAERIVVGTPEVPIGRYTAEILERASAQLGADFRASFEAKVVSRELNVKQVLAKVSLGEADVGIVYRTDAIAAGDRVRILTIPSEFNVIAEYPIAAAEKAEHPGLAKDWLGLVRSESGKQALSAAGFFVTTTTAAAK